MNYLSLFSGVEGGGLAFQHLIEPKITCIGYVEIDDYCQRVIRQRQIDGLLDKAPIYGDIRTFIDSGCAELYRGITDVVTAGFPCQPFSIAGHESRGKGEADERNLWPETIKTINLVRPKYIFLENVPNILVHKYVQRIFGDLAQSGYDAKWDCISASFCGAKHKRKRWWAIAYSKSEGLEGYWKGRKNCSAMRPERFTRTAKHNSKNIWGNFQADILGMDDDVAYRVDRLKAIGNGQVPQCAALAWKILSGMVEE